MRSTRRTTPPAAADGSSWTCQAAPAVDGSSWTSEAQQQRGSSWTRTAAMLRGSSWTREAQQQRGSSWTSQAAGSSWTREAQQQRGSSWTRIVPRALVAGVAALAVGAGGAPAFAATTADNAADAPAAQPGGTYLVRADAAHLADVARTVRRLGGTVVRTMSAVGMLQVSLPTGRINALRHAVGVLGATPNGAVKLATDNYTADATTVPNATTAVGLRGASGYATTGAGVDVALVDSGITPVPGLETAGKVVYGPDLSFESQNANTRYLDTFGHGTHLAGIIAGHDAGVNAGSVKPDDPAFLGAAPDARLLSVKVADSQGRSDVTQVIAGIDWVVEHAHDSGAGLNVRVLNLAFGTDSNAGYLRDPLCQAVEVAWRQGIVVVVSAGNRGSDLGHLTDPAIDPYVISVAAGDGANGVADFSSIGDGVRNPDVTAPGSRMLSLRVPGSFVDQKYGSAVPAGSRFIKGSGTSQAAAFTSGMVADMLQKNPGLSPDEVKARLRGTATPLKALPNAGGAGLVNAAALNPTGPSTDRGPAADTSTASIAVAPTDVTQRYATSTGDGPLDATRGSFTLYDGHVALTGDRDIFGNAWDGARLAKERAKVHVWKGGRYNGADLTGSAWGGSAWGGSAWGGSAWGGSAWGGSAWGGSAWGGSAWGSSFWE